MTVLIATRCPYCGEPIELVADESAGAQDYIEDCPVCCRPIQVRASVAEDGEALLELSRDDEA